MGKVNDLLSERLNKSGQTSKMASLAKQSAEGSRTSFTGFFGVADLSNQEKESLEQILQTFGNADQAINEDLNALITITSEVKAINNQAALLHGMRIKRVQKLLLNYREGAFTAWLMTAYGNRQTPYNFLQYYEFYEGIPKELRPKMEEMPRQAVYTLASREGPIERKIEIVEGYQGETKDALLQVIRDYFPLAGSDKRAQNHAESAMGSLKRAFAILAHPSARVSFEQKEALEQMLKHLQSIIKNCK